MINPYKYVLLLATSFVLLFAGAYSLHKANADTQRYMVQCIGGVAYYVFSDSATVAYEPSGKVMKCRK